MTDSRTILLIGRSGRGKSTLANVITDTNDFKESSSSVSETKKIQLSEFAENNLDYQIIDTPGIGDTKMSDNEVLDIIAEAVYRAKDGISQVFFAIDGRFDQFEMATYDLLKTIIFDENITKHTTIIRTRFADFRKSNKCEEDVNSMAKEFQDKKSEIEKETNKLTTTDLAEIIKACNKVIHVDNPSIEIKNAREVEIKMRKNKRNKSREILLKHLNENCQGESYKPDKLKELSEAIAEDYFQYLKKKEELQKELDSLNSKKVSQIKEDKEIIDEKKESKTEEERNIGIIETQKIVVQLQDKKDRLQKEIQAKEKVIRQKVLKHIFHNYREISQELGGDIFLNSVTGDHNWADINSEFTNKGIVIKWLSQGFDYQQTKEWATALKNNFNPQIDAGFCAWLRDVKQLTIEKAKELNIVEKAKNEYVGWLKGEISIFDRHNQQLGKWEEIDERQIYSNLLLIGGTGSGKSTLANVLTNRSEVKREVITEKLIGKGNKCHECKRGFVEGKNEQGKDNKWIEATINEEGSYFFHEKCFNFKESGKAVSETKNFQVEKFTNQGKNYRVFDTVGINDTKLSKKEVLFKIAEGIYLMKEGINQVFLVVDKKFTSQEIEIFELLRNVILENKIAEHTTIVRTRFSGFHKEERCQEDRDALLEETKELEEIINSCNKIIHVDNPPVNVEWEDEKRVSEKKRKLSRDILLKHLQNNCSGNYKPLSNWDEIRSKIAKIADYVEGSEIADYVEENDIIGLEKIKSVKDGVINKVVETELRAVIEQVAQVSLKKNTS